MPPREAEAEGLDPPIASRAPPRRLGQRQIISVRYEFMDNVERRLVGLRDEGRPNPAEFVQWNPRHCRTIHDKWIADAFRAVGLDEERHAPLRRHLVKILDGTSMATQKCVSDWTPVRRLRELIPALFHKTLVERRDIIFGPVDAMILFIAYMVSWLPRGNNAVPFQIYEAMKLPSYTLTSALTYNDLEDTYTFLSVTGNEWSFLDDQEARHKIPISAWPPGISRQVTEATRRLEQVRPRPAQPEPRQSVDREETPEDIQELINTDLSSAPILLYVDDGTDVSTIQSAIETAQTLGDRLLEDTYTVEEETTDIVTREEVRQKYQHLFDQRGTLNQAQIRRYLRNMDPDDYLILAPMDKMEINVLARHFATECIDNFPADSPNKSVRSSTSVRRTELPYMARPWYRVLPAAAQALAFGLEGDQRRQAMIVAHMSYLICRHWEEQSSRARKLTLHQSQQHNAALQALETQRLALSSDLGKTRESSKRLNEKLVSENATLRTELAAAREQVAELEVNTDTTRNREITKLQERIDRQESKIAKTKTELRTRDARIAELEQSLREATLGDDNEDDAPEESTTKPTGNKSTTKQTGKKRKRFTLGSRV